MASSTIGVGCKRRRSGRQSGVRLLGGTLLAEYHTLATIGLSTSKASSSVARRLLIVGKPRRLLSLRFPSRLPTWKRCPRTTIAGRNTSSYAHSFSGRAKPFLGYGDRGRSLGGQRRGQPPQRSAKLRSRSMMRAELGSGLPSSEERGRRESGNPGGPCWCRISRCRRATASSQRLPSRVAVPIRCVRCH